MEKKVIKFNLVGTICILLLLIAIIVGLVVGIPKIRNKSNNKNETEKQKQEQLERIDEKKEYNQKISLENGKERECRMKYWQGKFGYAMLYDADSFKVVNKNNRLDDYISLYSNRVGIIVEKKEAKFENVYSQLEEEGNRIIEEDKEDYKNNTAKFKVDKVKINNYEVVKRTSNLTKNTEINYAIKKDDNTYYYITVYCSKDFEKEFLPIMEAMVESFEILM